MLDAERTDPTMHTLKSELDAPHEPPTACDPAELPDQSGRRYPLARLERSDMSLLGLLGYLFRILWWRVRNRAQK